MNYVKKTRQDLTECSNQSEECQQTLESIGLKHLLEENLVFYHSSQNMGLTPYSPSTVKLDDIASASLTSKYP